MKKLIVLITILLLVSGCSLSNSENYYKDESEYEVEINNPYPFGSGHYAGYEWAKDTGGSCSGNSASFNEGCEEYYRQIQWQI